MTGAPQDSSAFVQLGRADCCGHEHLDARDCPAGCDIPGAKVEGGWASL
jgi:hypothetical protein